MIRGLFFLWLIVSVTSVLAQDLAEVTIKGIVKEKNTMTPVEFATVVVGDIQSATPVTGTTTLEDGSFSIQTTRQQFFVEVSFIGFASKRIDDFSIENGIVDLGEITLLNDGEILDEVTVRAERSQTEFKLDKRVFNVGKDLSTTGASALDVLNNVPSVNVNIEGEISLRGSQGVQILINGKPSVLASDQGNALGTITADMIEQVEVITNPSAKHDAEGTSGIINIVIKKEERKGLNGSFSLNTGLPDNHSFGLSLNRRTEKFNLFSQLGVGYRELPQDGKAINRDLISNTSVRSFGKEYRNETFYNVILGTDYHINDRNVLTLSGFFAYEIEDQPSATSFELLDHADRILSSWERTEETQATNPKWQYELEYKRDFKNHENHTLLFSALGNYFGKNQESVFLNTTVFGSETGGTQRTRTDFLESENTFKLDYTNPFKEKYTLETGAQYVINDVSNDYEVNNILDGNVINDPGQTNIFNYYQQVFATYGTLAFEGEKWGVKGGLRIENTNLHTLLEKTNEENKQNYANFFPSLHTSLKLSEKTSLQAGYSRRIFRPRLWDLNPFFNIRNNYSIRTGNPELQPEFTDSYELASIFLLGETSFNVVVYHRYTQDVVERISTFEDNVNTVKPENIGTNHATGIEFNTKYSATAWLTFNADFNYNYFNRQGTFDLQNFDFQSDQWSGKITTKIKMPADLEAEITTRYESGFQTVQSMISSNAFADAGLRKKLFKGKGVINLSVRDIFASRIRERISNQADFYLYDWGKRGRFVALGFSYGFGKGEAMEFSGMRRH
ncbi:MAG: TonB-dependent receptor [Saprospiraceae bacterium]|nr:TonB-dependent receptor [Saprospiraceae bacterium]